MDPRGSFRPRFQVLLFFFARICPMIFSHQPEDSMKGLVDHDFYQSKGVTGDALPTLTPRDGSNGVIYCNCNLGNFNNQLITCKVCASLAYFSNRKNGTSAVV